MTTDWGQKGDVSHRKKPIVIKIVLQTKTGIMPTRVNKRTWKSYGNKVVLCRRASPMGNGLHRTVAVRMLGNEEVSRVLLDMRERNSSLGNPPPIWQVIYLGLFWDAVASISSVCSRCHGII